MGDKTKHPLKVFLCHASVDKPRVRVLYRYLRKRGIAPWLDEEDLIPGQDWQSEIPKALKTSDAIIICLSKNSIDKDGYVQKEIKFALDKALEMSDGRIFLIPAKLEECELPYSLNRYQAVNLFDEVGHIRLMKALKLRASQLQRSNVETDLEIQKPASEEDFRSGTLSTPETGQRISRKNPVELKHSRNWNMKFTIAIVSTVVIICAAVFASMQLKDRLSTAPISTSTVPVITTTKEIFPVSTITHAGPTITPDLITPILPTSTSTILFTETPVFITTPEVFDPHPNSSDYIDSKGVSMRLVREDSFTMGSDTSDSFEMPAHTVYLDAYYMDKYEITNGLYKACVDDGVCDPPANTNSNTRASYYGNPEFSNYPVIYVSWDMAKIYCEWRGGGLPTEAQWEKAARGTDVRIFPWGNNSDINRSLSNYFGIDTRAVGDYEMGKSPYGIYDMTGNVWEWVADWYSPTFYRDSPYRNPSGPETGSSHIMRGSSWHLPDPNIRVFDRYADAANPGFDVGFRCAKSVK